MSISSHSTHESKPPPNSISPSKFVNLIWRHMSTTMRTLKLKDRMKTTQVHAFNSNSPNSTSTTKPNPIQNPLTLNSILSFSSSSDSNFSLSSPENLLLYGLPVTLFLESPIDLFLKSLDFVDSLADLHSCIEICFRSDKLGIYLEQYALFCSIGDTKLLRRSLQSARQHAVDVHSKVVLSAWLRYERSEDELVGSSPLNCVGQILECPKASLIHGYELVVYMLQGIAPSLKMKTI